MATEVNGRDLFFEGIAKFRTTRDDTSLDHIIQSVSPISPVESQEANICIFMRNGFRIYVTHTQVQNSRFYREDYDHHQLSWQIAAVKSPIKIQKYDLEMAAYRQIQSLRSDYTCNDQTDFAVMHRGTSVVSTTGVKDFERDDDSRPNVGCLYAILPQVGSKNAYQQQAVEAVTNLDCYSSPPADFIGVQFLDR